MPQAGLFSTNPWSGVVGCWCYDNKGGGQWAGTPKTDPPGGGGRAHGQKCLALRLGTCPQNVCLEGSLCAEPPPPGGDRCACPGTRGQVPAPLPPGSVKDRVASTLTASPECAAGGRGPLPARLGNFFLRKLNCLSLRQANVGSQPGCTAGDPLMGK